MEGWDQTRYEEYSELYYSIYEYNLSPAYTSAEIQQRIGDAQDKSFKIQSFYVNTVQKDTEFERAWFSAFSNFILGLNAEIVSYQKQKNLGEGRRVKVMDSTRNPDVPPEEIFVKGGFEDTQEAKEWREKAHFHFNKSLEYSNIVDAEKIAYDLMCGITNRLRERVAFEFTYNKDWKETVGDWNPKTKQWEGGMRDYEYFTSNNELIRFGSHKPRIIMDGKGNISKIISNGIVVDKEKGEIYQEKDLDT